MNIANIENKLNALKIAGSVVNITENTFFTGYVVQFNPDITINRINARLNDLSSFFGRPVELDTRDGLMILKVLKDTRDMVGIYDFTVDIAGGLDGYIIPLIIGQAEDGTRLYYDLVKMPHLLAGGATGSGKSVFLHNCILSTIYTGIVNLVLIDVKKTEFSLYEGIPHLCHSICYDAKSALSALKDLNVEMSRRYELLKISHCRNIQEYNNNVGKLNYIAVFIDELADLVMTDHRIETQLIHLAQLGRASGIHLILATQRPDAHIISGLIRINVPSRVCFAVQKSTDSRIILDMNGGELLRGAGDGLFLPIGDRKPKRIQAPYISTPALIQAIDKARHVND